MTNRSSGSRHMPARMAVATMFTLVLGILAISSGHAVPVAQATTGGSGVVVKPKIKKIVCKQACERSATRDRARGSSARGSKHADKGARRPRSGSTIRINGVDLRFVRTVTFLGSRGAEDDTSAPAMKVTNRSLSVKIPAGTATGRLVVITADGTRSNPSPVLNVLPQPPVVASPELKRVAAFNGPPGATLETGTSTPRTVFLGAKSLVRFSLRVNGIDGAVAAISLLRQSSGEVVASWNAPAPDGKIISVEWNGAIGGRPATAGRYVFKASIASLAGLARTGQVLPAPDAGDTRNAFDLHGFIFPVRGRHDFGQRAAKFGGGRGHQGQDILSRCNTRIVAARGGIVVESRRQSAAGNFIVVRSDFGGGDQAYMHLNRPSPFKRGDRVYTGQKIGNVGRTGRASACHLHFEQWTGEIWRTSPVDPLPDLLAWDAIS